MSFSDDILMAFADGELDEATRREVELAMRRDPAIAEKVRRHKAARANLYDAFSSTLDEQVPQRLHAAARSGKVVHLDSVRPVKVAPPAPPPPKPRWSWPEWGALAATLVVGVIAGSLGFKSINDAATLAAVEVDTGMLVAQGKLAAALNQQLTSISPDPERGGMQVGLSFVGKSGAYCRSFSMPKLAGLACRESQGWTVPILINHEPVPGRTGLPPALLAAIEERIVGPALDASAEKLAQQRGWKRQE
ncbi:MAG: hypothetical protein V4723_16225 [Pseudomonadota bacterium]